MQDPNVGPVRTVSNAGTILWLSVLASAFLGGFLILLRTRPAETGSPLDASFYVVGGTLFVAAVALFTSIFRFPYQFCVSPSSLKVRYLHRHEEIPAGFIRSIELRGGLISRNVYLMRKDGTETPMGTRNPSLVSAWQKSHTGVTKSEDAAE